MTALVKYDAAVRALAECKAVDEVKDLRNRAEAMRVYAAQAKNKTLEVDAAEIRIRAERRLGELIAAQKDTVGLNRGTTVRGAEKDGSPVVVTDDHREKPTLADAGISKDLSARAQKLASVPAEEFESEIGDWRNRVEAENARVVTRLADRGTKAKPGASSPIQALETRVTELEAALIDARDNAAELAAELEACEAIRQGEEVKKLRELQGQLRTVQSQRDDYMNQNAEMKRQITHLRRRLGDGTNARAA